MKFISTKYFRLVIHEIFVSRKFSTIWFVQAYSDTCTNPTYNTLASLACNRSCFLGARAANAGSLHGVLTEAKDRSDGKTNHATICVVVSVKWSEIDRWPAIILYTGKVPSALGLHMHWPPNLVLQGFTCSFSLIYMCTGWTVYNDTQVLNLYVCVYW